MTAVSTRETGARPGARPGARGGLSGGRSRPASGNRGSRPARGTSLTARWTGTDAPWNARDLVRTAYFVLAGLLGLGVSWFGMSAQADWRDQIPWLAGGVLALLVSGIGIVSWLLTGVRGVHTEMVELVSAVRVVYLGLPSLLDGEDVDDLDGDLADVVTDAGPVEIPTFVSNRSMTRAHKPDCPLVRGKSVTAVTDDDFVQRGLKLCGVCCG